MSYLRGQATLLEVVFVGQCDVFVCLLILNMLFSPLSTKLIGSRTGVSSLKKNVDVSVVCLLKRTVRQKKKKKKLWCSGSMLASHARGPGFNPRAGVVTLGKFLYTNCLC